MNRIKILIILLVIIFSNKAHAQFKNNNWLIGFTPLLFDFQHDSLENSIYTNTIRYWDGHSDLCDSTGLLFSCNGFNIYDIDGMLMENGKNILPEKLINSSQGGSFSRYNQQSIILPKKDNQFYVFAWGMSDKNFDEAQINGGWYINDILTYSIVDLDENDGKGKVVSKLNYLLENDSLGSCQMSAVRHANGRDWWLVKPHLFRHEFYTFLVTPEGIEQQLVQSFDTPLFAHWIIGQSNFSLDGSLFAMTSENQYDISQVNYFDRCSGKLNKFKTIPSPFEPHWNTIADINSICFSPNNQFVYLINNQFIYQYDLSNDEIIELHTDSLYNPCEYTMAYNAPDGRIYIGNFSGLCSAISYIEFPDKKGKAAGLCQLCYQTKNTNTLSPPNMPNYELGALKGSPCDTIGKLHASTIVIYPNPASSTIHVFIPLPTNTSMHASLYNMLGQMIYAWDEMLNTKQEVELSLNHIAKGMYMLRIETDELNYTGKLLVR